MNISRISKFSHCRISCKYLVGFPRILPLSESTWRKIEIKKLYVWFLPTDFLVNRKECSVARQWLLEFSIYEYCQSALHSLFCLLGNQLERTKRNFFLETFQWSILISLISIILRVKSCTKKIVSWTYYRKKKNPLHLLGP